MARSDSSRSASRGTSTHRASTRRTAGAGAAADRTETFRTAGGVSGRCRIAAVDPATALDGVWAGAARQVA